MTPVRARFVLVVSDLKPDPRGGMWRGAGYNAIQNQGDCNYACNLKHVRRLLNPTTDNSDNQIITPSTIAPSLALARITTSISP
jgi:hypothetical protein